MVYSVYNWVRLLCLSCFLRVGRVNFDPSGCRSSSSSTEVSSFCTDVDRLASLIAERGSKINLYSLTPIFLEGKKLFFLVSFELKHLYF